MSFHSVFLQPTFVFRQLLSVFFAPGLVFQQYPCTCRLLQCSSVRGAGLLLFAEIGAVKLSVLTLFFPSDMKKVGVTVVGPQKKIVSSIKALETHTKNSPVPV